MAILWTAMTYEVDGLETKVHFFIRHDIDAVLSFKVALEPITVDYYTQTQRQDFTNSCLTVVTVTYAATTGVRVSLTWT